MTGAMYAAIAGLKTHMSKLNVVGNNIANVNTNGYKSQRTVFRDALYTMYSGGSDGTTTTGSKNPSQIGYGSQVSSIDLNMTTGNYSPGNTMDCMLYGDGFFLVGNKTTAASITGTNPDSFKALKLTRVGDFRFGADGYLVDGKGNPVYGFMNTGVDKDGNPQISDQLVPIRLPKVEYAKEVERIDQRVTQIEQAAGLPVGGIKLWCNIESYLGVMNAQEIAKASPEKVAAAVKVTQEAPLPAELDSGMHKVSIIVQLAKFETLKKALNDIGVTGMTVTQVMGCGLQKGSGEKYRGAEVDATLLPKVKVEVVVSKIPVDKIIDTATKALYTGHIGDGKIFVYNVAKVVKVRTGEQDYAALQDVE